MRPLSFRAMWKEANSSDKMPKKKIKKWKKKARQIAKKDINLQYESKRK